MANEKLHLCDSLNEKSREYTKQSIFQREKEKRIRIDERSDRTIVNHRDEETGYAEESKK
jgi:hypothetical protein